MFVTNTDIVHRALLSYAPIYGIFDTVNVRGNTKFKFHEVPRSGMGGSLVFELDVEALDTTSEVLILLWLSEVSGFLLKEALESGFTLISVLKENFCNNRRFIAPMVVRKSLEVLPDLKKGHVSEDFINKVCRVLERGEEVIYLAEFERFFLTIPMFIKLVYLNTFEYGYGDYTTVTLNPRQLGKLLPDNFVVDDIEHYENLRVMQLIAKTYREEGSTVRVSSKCNEEIVSSGSYPVVTINDVFSPMFYDEGEVSTDDSYSGKGYGLDSEDDFDEIGYGFRDKVGQREENTSLHLGTKYVQLPRCVTSSVKCKDCTSLVSNKVKFRCTEVGIRWKYSTVLNGESLNAIARSKKKARAALINYICSKYGEFCTSKRCYWATHTRRGHSMNCMDSFEYSSMDEVGQHELVYEVESETRGFPSHINPRMLERAPSMQRQTRRESAENNLGYPEDNFGHSNLGPMFCSVGSVECEILRLISQGVVLKIVDLYKCVTLFSGTLPKFFTKLRAMSRVILNVEGVNYRVNLTDRKVWAFLV